jgi:hypothetical protein
VGYDCVGGENEWVGDRRGSVGGGIGKELRAEEVPMKAKESVEAREQTDWVDWRPLLPLKETWKDDRSAGNAGTALREEEGQRESEEDVVDGRRWRRVCATLRGGLLVRCEGGSPASFTNLSSSFSPSISFSLAFLSWAS